MKKYLGVIVFTVLLSGYYRLAQSMVYEKDTKASK